MEQHNPRPLNDVIIHEQDLRGAVDAPGARDTAALRLVRERMLARFASALPEGVAVELVGQPAPGQEGFHWSSYDEGRPTWSSRLRRSTSPAH